ncbi:FKBP-type peptidyl-prolyl cis-trans isomerase [Povalibacter sp.]|uniref:FKBP-type peptidyl-prolyl cis-trans isomerase n=1 Tax=Povalibacter sp. TaxID=1962978 RepID=UPI002F4024F0
MKRNMSVVAVLGLTAACMGGCSRQPQAKDVAEMEAVAEERQQDFRTLEDRFSYAYGAELAEKFRAEGIELNVALMAAAMQAVFDGGEKKMSAGEVAATMEVYREVHLKKKETERVVAAEKNTKEGEVFLRENARKEGVVVTRSGLQYKVITRGSGGRKPTLEDDVKVHYRGRLIDGSEFDSTYSRSEPYSTNPKMLIEGWAEALQLMTEGSKWELYVPADLAYGDEGSPPHVGPNAVLIFEVELLEIEKK